MRLIDADELMEHIERYNNTVFYSTTQRIIHDAKIEFALDEIQDAPTIEAEPIRYAQWLPFTVKSGPFIGCTGYKCSLCGREEEDNGEPYCHCGAKMKMKM